MNVVMVKNYKDGRTRLYSLSDEALTQKSVPIEKGTKVGVRYQESDLISGEIVSNGCYTLDDATWLMVADLLGMAPDAPLKPVCILYSPHSVLPGREDDA